MSVKSYAAAEVIVTFGAIIIDGFADGDAIQVIPNADSWTSQRGIGREVSRSRMGDEGAIVTLTLLQTAAINAVLSAIFKLDRINRDQVFPLMIKDNSGFSLHTAMEAWIMRKPDGTYAEEATGRAWVFEVAEMDDVHGGN